MKKKILNISLCLGLLFLSIECTTQKGATYGDCYYNVSDINKSVEQLNQKQKAQEVKVDLLNYEQNRPK